MQNRRADHRRGLPFFLKGHGDQLLKENPDRPVLAIPVSHFIKQGNFFIPS
jgi:hypothetical protein